VYIKGKLIAWEGLFIVVGQMKEVSIAGGTNLLATVLALAVV
jgi:hypothetical protein